MLRKAISVVNSFIIPSLFDDFLDELSTEEFSKVNYNLQTLFNEIDGLHGQLDDFGDFPSRGSYKLSIDRLNKADINIIELNSLIPSLHKSCAVLGLYTTWHEPAKIQDRNREEGIHITREVVTRICVGFGSEVGLKLLVLMSIALPGSSRCLFSYDSLDRDRHRTTGCISDLASCSIILAKAQIEPKISLRFDEVLQWSIKQPGYWRGRSSNNVSRAINYFSHIHQRIFYLNNFADLAWIIGGLETLFASEGIEIRQRIVRRLALIVPYIYKIAPRKKLLSLYDCRSKFLHGGMDVPNHFTDIKLSEKYYGHDFDENFNLLASMLILALQEIIKSGCHVVEFEEQLARSESQ